MGALLDKVNARIAAQRDEIERIKVTTRDELQRANAVLVTLVEAKDAVTPELEQLLGKLAAVGIKVEV